MPDTVPVTIEVDGGERPQRASASATVESGGRITGAGGGVLV